MAFNKNSRHPNERAQCAMQTVNVIRHIVSFSKRFEGDASRFNVTPEVLRTVQTLSKDCQERIAAEKLRQLSSSVLTQPRLVLVTIGRDRLQREVETTKITGANAEHLISLGIKSKSVSYVESGQSLLAEGKARMVAALDKMAQKTTLYL